MNAQAGELNGRPICPGGLHPFDPRRAHKAPKRGMCCDGCYDRMPRDLPGFPKFRSRLRNNFAARQGISPNYYECQDENRAIYEAIRTWLADNPRETSNP